MLSVDVVRRRREQLRDVLAPFCGVELGSDDLWLAAAALAKVMQCSPDVIAETLRRTSIGMLTVRGAFDLAWRLAGNIDVLRTDQPLAPFTPPAAPLLSPAQFVSVRRVRTLHNKLGVLYKVRFLAGPACPSLVNKFWPVTFLPVLSRALGFPPPWKPGAYRDAADLVRVRFEAEITSEFCRDGRPGFDRVGCGSADKNWNRSLFKARAHLEPPCPHKYDHPCHLCPIGYGQCPAGTHPLTYEFKTCRLCHNANKPHDPDSGTGNCLDCDSLDVFDPRIANLGG